MDILVLSLIAGLVVAGGIWIATRPSRILTVADQSQVVDFACDLVTFQSGNRGGGYLRRGYTLDAALQLIPLLREIGTAKLAGVPDVLRQAFGAGA